MSESSSTLSALVSTTASLLVYSIPLLIFSIPLTFAGTFLTLDRSRSFPSAYTPVTSLPGAFDTQKKSSKSKFPLQGGVGGLLSGYVFGVHLSTFLSLLVPTISSSAPLTLNSFLAVWLLSCILTTIVGGRYWYCARIFPAVTGGSSLALTICVIIHPPLLPRQVLTGLFVGMSTLLVMVFSLPHFTQILRPSLRVSMASSGAFSLVLSVALLAHIPAWSNVWERLWLSDGDSWGTSKEKGLSTFCVILFIAGIAADFGFNHWLGECPDEEWDNFLAVYSANLPNDSDRAGSFRPLPSFWGRLLRSSRKGDNKDDLFPLTFPRNARNSTTTGPGFLSDDDYDKDFARSSFYDVIHDSNPTSPTFLKKVRSSQNVKFKRKKRGRGFRDITSVRKHPIKFGHNFSSESSDEDWDAPPRNVRPLLKRKASMSSSSPTLVNQPTATALEHKSQKTRTETGSVLDIAPVYSDYEEDICIPQAKLGITHYAGWRPGFLNRYLSSAGVDSVQGAATSSTGGQSSTPIPATPSLVKALDRLSAAQKQAFRSINGSSTFTSTQSSSSSERKGSTTTIEGLPKVTEADIEDVDSYSDTEVNRTGRLLAPVWEEFWNEVEHKAAS